MNQNFAEFEENGFVILENILDKKNVSILIEELSKLKPSNSVSRKNKSVYGVRNLLNLSQNFVNFRKAKLSKTL